MAEVGFLANWKRKTCALGSDSSFADLTPSAYRITKKQRPRRQYLDFASWPCLESKHG